ncbi:peptidase family M1-domain-containing protein [Obelidium mucronatum]|nr:peptidase family M1-domain-containing protein [Obelidium mucronatum]
MCKCHSLYSNEAPIAGGASVNAEAPRELLPADLVPTNYKIRIAPSLETFEFTGTVAIEANVVAATKTVVLNSKNLKVHNAWVTYSVEEGSVRRQEAKDISFDEDLERVSFTFLEDIPAGVVAVVSSEFTGIHNDQMAGFYRSSYVDDAGNKRYMLATQFESTDARQCIPCFDEPGLKATFDCTLVVDADLVALSNMNDISTVLSEDSNGKKIKEVTFARTPLMSTYLLAFVVGDLECIETTSVPKKPAAAQPITVRLFTTKGLVEQGRFALETAARTLEYFSEYFDEAYPLPKSDMVAIPDFSAGAMENWGLVTYRNVYLLCDEKKATANQKKMIGYIVGHELAHQWFGNLVTMTWWNDLWLNEGFATFVGWLSTDFLFPEWDVWTGFITGEMSQALNLDGLRSSHPIDVDVKSAKEVSEIFDAISYSKGASVIRMLNDFLGGQVFMDGVRTYLQEFKYKNTVTADLWKHLSASSGKDIASLMHSWTRETGYPLISVESESYDDESKTISVTLSQSRFLSGGELKPEEDTVNWWVPITVVSHLTGKTGATRHVLSEKQGTISFPYDASADAFWKLNFGASGLYRVKYSEAQVATIGRILETKPETFSVGDRIMFLSDAFKLTTAGFGSISTLLNMIKSLASETDYNVLLEISNTLATLRSFSYLEPQPVIDGLKTLGREVFSAKSFVALPSGSVLSDVTPETAEETFAAIWGIYINPANQANERNVALQSVGAINSFEHVDRILNTYIFDQDIIKSQDFHMPLSSMVQFSPSPAVVRPVLVEWFKNSFDKILTKFPDGRALGGVLSLSVGGSVGETVLADVNAFIRGDGLSEDAAAKRVKELEPAKRAIDQVLESVTTKTKFMDRERDNLAAFFA